jgi:hypothetical protein
MARTNKILDSPEDELVDTMRAHRVQQAHRVHDVVVIVLLWVLRRLSYLNERGKVHDRVTATRQDPIQHRMVTKVALTKFAGQHGIAVPTRKVCNDPPFSAQVRLLKHTP